jgi:[acyl-carrier-protein] S-malonyltransferase
MGEDFLEVEPLSQWFEEICAQVDFPMRKIILEGPADQLERTRFTQPAVFTINHLIYKYIEDHFGVEVFAGHSLGEYNALVAGDWTTFDDLLPVVKERGRAMDDAANSVNGTMAAILRLDLEELEELCQSISEDPGIRGSVQVALYNSPSQRVVSGSKDAVEEAGNRAKEAGALKAVPLDVSGPWHSEYMEAAETPLREALGRFSFQDGEAVYANVTAQPTNIDDVGRNLIDQLTKPVRWQSIIEELIENGLTRFVEVGPGDALSGMIGRIADRMDKKVDCFTTDNLSETKSLLEDH